MSSAKLGFSLQLSSLRFLGTFCTDVNTIPENATTYVAAQLKVNPREIHNCKGRQTKDDHVKLIRNIYGYKEFDHLKKYLSNWLLNRATHTTESTNMLLDILPKKCLDEKIILPRFTTSSRFIASIVEKTEEQLYRQLALIPTNKEKKQLLDLLELVGIPVYGATIEMDILRTPLTGYSLKEISRGFERLKQLQALSTENW